MESHKLNGEPAGRMEMTVCGILFRNPVLAASGTFGYGIEFEKLVDLNELGGIVIKGLSRDPIRGNPAPRLWETRAGMINSVGLQNVGVRAFIADKLPGLRRYPTPVVANVFGYAAEDYVEVVHALNDADGIAAYELNVSCPNTKHGGLAFGVDEAALGELVDQVKRVATRPLIVKLSPNVAAIEPFAHIRENLSKTGLADAHVDDPHSGFPGKGACDLSLAPTRRCQPGTAALRGWHRRTGPEGMPITRS